MISLLCRDCYPVSCCNIHETNGNNQTGNLQRSRSGTGRRLKWKVEETLGSDLQEGELHELLCYFARNQTEAVVIFCGCLSLPN